MTKNDLLKLQTDAGNISRLVEETIKSLTKDNPLVLFDRENLKDEENEPYDFPSGFNVDKYGSYEQGAVMRVEGEAVTLFLTGDNYGQEYHTELCWISFDNQIGILTYLIERA
jgi:hypothetical protein